MENAYEFDLVVIGSGPALLPTATSGYEGQEYGKIIDRVLTA